jgi:hypothetical protein
LLLRHANTRPDEEILIGGKKSRVARGSRFNVAGILSLKFCKDEGRTVGVGDGDGEAEEAAVDVADEEGTAAIGVEVGSAGIGDKTGEGAADSVEEGSVVGFGVELGVGLGDVDSTGVSGAGEFSSAKVGAILDEISATTNKATKRIINFVRRL